MSLNLIKALWAERCYQTGIGVRAARHMAAAVEPFVLRPFRRADLDEVIAVNRACLPENYSPYFFLEIHERFPKGFLVAENEGRIAGYVMCRIEYGGSHLKRFGLAKKGHVVSLAVLPEHRRRGIATALMKEAMRNLRSEGASECFLEVRVSNAPALELYRSLGFTEVDRLEAYYMDGEDAYVLATRLEDRQAARANAGP
ncbi:MAG: ribosomal protein S18-alanine N-acetyltransferase [Candidatus Bathyarchaeia archaeon]